MENKKPDTSDIIYAVLAVAFAIALNFILRGSSPAKTFLIVVYGFVAALIYFARRKTKLLVWFFSFYVIASLMVYQSYIISVSQGTVLSNNWWVALNWIKNNTPECSVIATYWDPGHFITGIANRQVVFDGATQNSLRIINMNGTRIVRSRIQDIATVLYTDNETEAVEILRNYRNGTCPMYFIASRDLIFKSQWWTYFSTWSPKTHTGTKYVYYPASLFDRRPLISGKGMEYDYSLGNQVLRVILTNETIRAFIDNGVSQMPVGKIYYFSDSGIYVIGNSSDIALFFYAGSPSAILVPKELENSLFTRMFFFNGYGLERFRFVDDWGGEVKLFEVVFDNSTQG